MFSSKHNYKMKYLVIILLFCGIHSNAQITGNPNVTDINAINLDSKAVISMIGKWKLVKTVEHIQNDEQVRDRGIIVDFDKEGTIITSWCIDCYQEKAGLWQILKEQIIKFDDNRAEKNRYLAGEWVVYKLTDQEMILAKVLTSSGDWKKYHYFSRNIGNPPITEVDRYCINCSGGSWCFGDRPDEAKRQFAIVHDLVNSDSDQQQHSAEIIERYDWLLNNAPCFNVFLYVNAVKYYESLLKDEKNIQVAKDYQEKIKKIKEQQQLYFKN
jgi:thiol-disulfide isomerase/thioredoxin